MDNLWSFDNNVNSEIEPNPVKLIYDYAEQVANDTGGLIQGIITETVFESEIVFGFYLGAKKIRNYSYRLFQITFKSLLSPYPITCIQYAKVETNNQYFECGGYLEFESKLKAHILNPISKMILQSIKVHIEIVEEYNRDL